MLDSLDEVGSGIPHGPSKDVLEAITAEVHLAMYHDEWKTCAVCDERAPSVSLPGRPDTHRLCTPHALPPSAYTTLRVPTPSGALGASAPSPGRLSSFSHAEEKYDQDLLDQYNVTLHEEYFASPSTNVLKDKRLLERLLLSPRPPRPQKAFILTKILERNQSLLRLAV